MVQLADTLQVERAINNLTGVEVFNSKLIVTYVDHVLLGKYSTFRVCLKDALSVSGCVSTYMLYVMQ